MKRLFLGVASAFFMMPDSQASAKVETIKGQLIDKACYDKDHRNTGQTHVRKPIEECATVCVKYGLPVGLLTSDGKVYQVVGEMADNKNAKLLSHLMHAVELTGEVTEDAEGAMKIAATALKMTGK